MNVKCAIFDFDGTLFDSMYVWDTAGDRYLQSLGKTPNPSMYETVKTMSLSQAAFYFKEAYGIDQSVEEIIEGILDTVRRCYADEIMPKPGVVDFLYRMVQTGATMCIATASDPHLIETALNRCDMAHYFDRIFTCDEVRHSKEDPTIFRSAMATFNADRSNTLIFEDAYHAIQTAKNDGFITVGVYDDSEVRQDEIKRISDWYLKDFSEMDQFWRFISTSCLTD